MKKIVKGLLIVAVLGCAGFFAYKAGFLDKFMSGSIEDTPNVVENIRNISELTTACYFEEIIVSEPINRKDSLIMVAEGTVRAGFNLKDLTEDKITALGDSLLNIRLPKAKIYDVIINPDNYRFLEGEDKKSEEAVNRALAKAKKRIVKDAMKDGILDKATESGKKQLTEMFKAFGYNEVNVEIE